MNVKATYNSGAAEEYSLVTVLDPLLSSLTLHSSQEQKDCRIEWFNCMAVFIFRGLLKNPAGLPLLYRVVQHCLLAL